MLVPGELVGQHVLSGVLMCAIVGIASHLFGTFCSCTPTLSTQCIIICLLYLSGVGNTQKNHHKKVPRMANYENGEWTTKCHALSTKRAEGRAAGKQRGVQCNAQTANHSLKKHSSIREKQSVKSQRSCFYCFHHLICVSQEEGEWCGNFKRNKITSKAEKSWTIHKNQNEYVTCSCSPP